MSKEEGKTVTVSPTLMVGMDSVPTYDGTSDIFDFLEHIETTALIAQWSDEQKLAITKLKLVGFARQYLNSTETAKNSTDWQHFCNLLKVQFKAKTLPGQELKNFVECRQRHGESCRQFLTRIRIIGNKIKGTSADKNTAAILQTQFEKDLLRQFVLGLIPSVRDKVLASQPKTIEDALDKAEIEEMIESLNKVKIRNHWQEQAITKTCSYCKIKGHGMEECRKINKIGLCFKCNRPGHFKRECPQWNQEKSQSQNAYRREPPRNNNSFQYRQQERPRHDNRPYRRDRERNTANYQQEKKYFSNRSQNYQPQETSTRNLNVNAATFLPQNAAAAPQDRW